MACQEKEMLWILRPKMHAPCMHRYLDLGIRFYLSSWIYTCMCILIWGMAGDCSDGRPGWILDCIYATHAYMVEWTRRVNDHSRCDLRPQPQVFAHVQRRVVYGICQRHGVINTRIQYRWTGACPVSGVAKMCHRRSLESSFLRRFYSTVWSW